MYPGMFHHWKRSRRHGCDSRVHADGSEEQSHHHRRRRRRDSGVEELLEAAGRHGHHFGVRRPLRFMAHRLDLSEEQIKQLAQVLADLKTERAQAEVDDRRTVGNFADALEADDFDEGIAKEGGDRRVASAERLREAVLKALRRTHEVLDEEQRAKLAYLLRSGTLTI